MPHNTHSMSTCDGTYVDHTLHERKILAFLAGGGGPRPLGRSPDDVRVLAVLAFALFHFLYITEASTLAGEKVLGSLRREMTLRRMVLEEQESAWGNPWPRVLPGSLPP